MSQNESNQIHIEVQKEEKVKSCTENDSTVSTIHIIAKIPDDLDRFDENSAERSRKTAEYSSEQTEQVALNQFA